MKEVLANGDYSIYTESNRFRLCIESFRFSKTLYLEFHHSLERFIDTNRQHEGSNKHLWIRIHELQDAYNADLTKKEISEILSDVDNIKIHDKSYNPEPFYYETFADALEAFKKEVPRLLFELNEV